VTTAPVPARCGAGHRSWLPDQAYRRYTAGISQDHGIGMVASLHARRLAALCAVLPDHVHRVLCSRAYAN
jgi:hypothetical protein